MNPTALVTLVLSGIFLLVALVAWFEDSRKARVAARKAARPVAAPVAPWWLDATEAVRQRQRSYARAQAGWNR